jgi:hypothetical protein
VDETGLRSCLVTGFGINSVEAMGCITNVNYIMHVYDEPSPFSDGVIWLK